MVTPAKYECGWTDLTSPFGRKCPDTFCKKIPWTVELMNGTSVTPTAEQLSPQMLSISTIIQLSSNGLFACNAPISGTRISVVVNLRITDCAWFCLNYGMIMSFTNWYREFIKKWCLQFYNFHAYLITWKIRQEWYDDSHSSVTPSALTNAILQV